MNNTLTGFLGVLIGASIPILYEAWKDWSNKSKKAHYTGVRILAKLNLFIDECADIATDDGTLMGQLHPNETRRAQTTEPDLLMDDDSFSWEAIDKKLMQDILNLPNEVKNCKLYLQSNAIHDGGDYIDTFEKRQYLFAKLGIHAHELVTELRKSLKLKQEKKIIDFDSLTTMKKQVELIDAKKFRTS